MEIDFLKKVLRRLLAILSPGVSAHFLGGSGYNGGLGNQAIWANGQRDTSNSFTLNVISGNSLFNGKTTSQVSSNRTVLSTGENFSNATGSVADFTIHISQRKLLHQPFTLLQSAIQIPHLN